MEDTSTVVCTHRKTVFHTPLYYSTDLINYNTNNWHEVHFKNFCCLPTTISDYLCDFLTVDTSSSADCIDEKMLFSELSCGTVKNMPFYKIQACLD